MFDKSKKYVDKDGDVYHHDGIDWIRHCRYHDEYRRSNETTMAAYGAKPIEEEEEEGGLPDESCDNRYKVYQYGPHVTIVGPGLDDEFADNDWYTLVAEGDTVEIHTKNVELLDG